MKARLRWGLGETASLCEENSPNPSCQRCPANRRRPRALAVRHQPVVPVDLLQLQQSAFRREFGGTWSAVTAAGKPPA